MFTISVLFIINEHQLYCELNLIFEYIWTFLSYICVFWCKDIWRGNRARSKWKWCKRKTNLIEITVVVVCGALMIEEWTIIEIFWMDSYQFFIQRKKRIFSSTFKIKHLTFLRIKICSEGEKLEMACLAVYLFKSFTQF